MANEDIFKKIIAHAKEYGFVFQSSELFDGLAAVYDYGQYGVELKKNIMDYWWKSMVQYHENIVGLDAAIFMHPNVWKSSGHVDAFNDPLIDNKDSKKRYRADELIEDHIEKIQNKIQKEVNKARKKFGEDFDEAKFRGTQPRVIKYTEQIVDIKKRMVDALEKEDLKALKQLIEDLEISDPVSGSKNWTDVRQFNLMFATQMGTTGEETGKLYLRPETAQGIFVNYLNVQKTGRMKIPFGIAQIGKAFRNEIVARQFIFRMREFEQMEMQFFVRPGTEKEWFEYWKEQRMQWHLNMGIAGENYRFHEHDKLAHYANAAFDIEFEFPMGFKELEGIHSRTDYDLSAHQKFTGKKIQYYDNEVNTGYVPYVVETSIGLDRTFLALLTAAYQEEKLEGGSERVMMKIPPFLAPVKAAILPLVKKDGLPEKAREIMDSLKYDYMCFYEEKDTIGKRYRRMHAIGTPYCITVDHQTLEDNTVTIRERDSMQQDRIPIEKIAGIIAERIRVKR
ncbi:MAG: glycine--tRNA ligase [Bacteroidales bacterium]|nr:glycine--tRNA ligase [Bacteroidales bacterium]